VETFGINFKQAREVVLNSSSLKLPKIDKDYVFIGPLDDLSKILVVHCITEDGFGKITWARIATPREDSAYFNFLAEGDSK
jgi:hypothetical protein